MTLFRHGPKPVIGLIGGIGAGKSTAAGCFSRRGGVVIDADALGHEALQQPDVLREVVGRWGEESRRLDGSIDRRAIARIVFADPAERSVLEGLVFPYIRKRCREEVARAQNNPAARFVILDAAVLLEAGWNDEVDRIVYLETPRLIRLARLATRSQWTDAELGARESAQWAAEVKKTHADVIIINASGLTELQDEVDRVLAGWGLLGE